jgi:type VI secretion system protein ImpK
MHLTDCFIEFFAFVTDFRQRAGSSQPPFAQVQETALDLLTKSGRLASQGEFPAADLEQARFAVCAWADEVMAGSQWQHKQLWLKERLQQTHFATTDAGEEFFERLAALKPEQRGVREVYYLCLVLGFTGRFCNAADRFHLQQLKESTLRSVTDGSPSPQNGEFILFPAAYPSARTGAAPAKRFPLSVTAVAALLAPLLILLALFITYRLTLSTVADNFLKTVVN